jgi:hypothetical protein
MSLALPHGEYWYLFMPSPSGTEHELMEQVVSESHKPVPSDGIGFTQRTQRAAALATGLVMGKGKAAELP